MGRDAAAPVFPPRSPTRRVWIAAALIFTLALLPRLAPLNRYVTPDEPAWVVRSLRFSQALSAGDPGAIPATGHPGVTTMWLGSLGLQIQRWLAPVQTTAHLDWLDGLAGLSPQSAAAFRHLAFLLPGGRILIALVTSLGLVAFFVLARRLWGGWIATLAALLLALDPFLAGHSGLLHLDGTLATAMTLAALAALLAVSPPNLVAIGPAAGHGLAGSGRPSPYSWIVLSGLLSGLATLTKTPGGFMAPFVGALLLAAWLTRRLSGRQALIALALWGLAAVLTFAVLYPALWSDPLTTLRGLLQVGERHVEGALRPVFYRGQITFDPDATFYPIVWLFRTSPLVLTGLPIALIAYIRRPGTRRFGSMALIALAIGFGLFVTLVGKKHDRYLLPAFPPLTLVAALGWEWVGKVGIGRLGIGRLRIGKLRIGKLGGWIVPVVPVVVQLFLILLYLSAPLGYYNPLVGGPRAAQSWLAMGWGEGLGAAARWLNQDPNAEDLIVATPSVPPLAALFVGQTVPLSPQTLAQADYVVYPVLQGAGPTLEVEARTPVYDYTVGGIRYASVIRNPSPGRQAAYLNEQARQGDLILLDGPAALTRRYQGPAEVALLADARDPSQIAGRLQALIPGHERLWYVALPTASPITAQRVRERLACNGQPVSSTSVAAATILQFAPNPAADRSPCETSSANGTLGGARFDALGLVDHALPSDPVAWPAYIAAVLRWEALEPLPADYRAVLHLTDDAGRTWMEGGQEIRDADYRRPSAWPTGEWADQTFRLDLPPAIPPGTYSVELSVFDPLSGMGTGVWDADGAFAGLSLNLGQVTVGPPQPMPTPWDMVVPKRREPPVIAGPLNLLGEDLPPARVASGDRVTFDLYWQANVAPSSDYALRWRLVSPRQEAGLEETVPLSPYPARRWRVNELEQVRYDLALAPELPAGPYTLSINVLDAAGAPLWPEDLPLTQIEIAARDRLFDLPAGIDYPLDLRLGTLVHLRGFDLSSLSVPPAGQLTLTLYWQADGPTDRSYTVFVHLVGADGMLHGQVDRPPAQGAAPTHTWAPGQVIIDAVSLPVLASAPQGIYHIAVGLYDAGSGDRLPVYDATDAQLPNRQIVLPVEVTVK